MFSLYSTNDSSPKKNSKEIWKLKLDTIINKHFMDSSFSVPELAKKMGISERSLYYKFKKQCNLTPGKYITEFRLIVAKKLLKEQKYATVSAVCFAVGFQTPDYFSKKFKNRFGKSPSTYLQF